MQQAPVIATAAPLFNMETKISSFLMKFRYF